jgi:hypothetical protein
MALHAWTYVLCKIKTHVSLGNITLNTCKFAATKVCGFIFFAMTNKHWRTRAEPIKVKTAVVTGPGGCVSVDQLDSINPGFVAQLKGILTNRRYTCATVFVDHFSRLGYVHMQKQLTSDETVEAKHAFEAFTTRCYTQKLSCR